MRRRKHLRVTGQRFISCFFFFQGASMGPIAAVAHCPFSNRSSHQNQQCKTQTACCPQPHICYLLWSGKWLLLMDCLVLCICITWHFKLTEASHVKETWFSENRIYWTGISLYKKFVLAKKTPILIYWCKLFSVVVV